MKILTSLVILTSLSLSLPCFSALSLGNSSTANTLSTLTQGLTQSTDTTSSVRSLVTSLSKQLNVSTTQAAGGTNSLLTYAKQALPAAQSKELTSLIPGFDSLATSLTVLQDTSASSMSDVSTTFSQLGMSSDMVTQFVPVILKYLTNQGASDELVSSLASLWQS